MEGPLCVTSEEVKHDGQWGDLGTTLDYSEGTIAEATITQIIITIIALVTFPSLAGIGDCGPQAVTSSGLLLLSKENAVCIRRAEIYWTSLAIKKYSMQIKPTK